MRLHQSLFFLIAMAGSVFAQNSKPIAGRLADQNALFEEQYESDLRNFPERATAFGDYRYNDKLADYSIDAIVQRHETLLARDDQKMRREMLVQIAAIEAKLP